MRERCVNTGVMPTRPEQTVVKAASPADLLALLPHLVGFEPRESVVFVPFRGKRSHGALRLDLPVTPKGYKGFVTFAIGTLCKMSDIEGMAVVIVTDAESSDSVPLRDLAEVAMRRIRHAGFALKEALWQTQWGWGSYLDESARGSLSEIRESEVNRHVPPLESEAHPIGTASAELIEMVESQIDRVRDEGPAAEMDLVDLFENALELAPAELGQHTPLFLSLLQSPPIRDAVMLQWASEAKFHDVIWDTSDTTYESTEEERKFIGDRMLGVGSRPDPARIEAGISLLHRLLYFAAPQRRPPLLCMLGWLNWALGRGSIAGKHVDEALALRPDYGMAEVLATILHNGMLPEWAFASEHPSKIGT